PESEFFDGLRAAGFEHLIKDQVNTNSLSAVVRELADDADVRDGTSSVISAALPNELSKIVTIDTSLTLGIRRV
nr:hypothetical protein [bacterium]